MKKKYVVLSSAVFSIFAVTAALASYPGQWDVNVKNGFTDTVINTSKTISGKGGMTTPVSSIAPNTSIQAYSFNVQFDSDVETTVTYTSQSDLDSWCQIDIKGKSIDNGEGGIYKASAVAYTGHGHLSCTGTQSQGATGSFDVLFSYSN